MLTAIDRIKSAKEGLPLKHQPLTPSDTAIATVLDDIYTKLEAINNKLTAGQTE